MFIIILASLFAVVFFTLYILVVVMQCNDIVIAKTKENTAYNGYYCLVNKNALFEHKDKFLLDNYKTITLINLIRFINSERINHI